MCLSCGEIFDEDEIYSWYETHGLDHGPYERWTGSPCCHEGYKKAKVCACCGDYITTEKYVDIGGEEFCMDCVEIKNLID